jgi:hypothetical protein
MDRLEFHVVQELNLAQNYHVVLLFHDNIETKDTGHILDPFHVHYCIIHIAGSVVYLDYVALLHNNRTRCGDAQDTPTKLIITICNEYILLRILADGNQQPNLLAELQSTSIRHAGTSSSSSGHSSLHRVGQWNRSALGQSRPNTDGTGGKMWTNYGQMNARLPVADSSETTSGPKISTHESYQYVKVGLSKVEVLDEASLLHESLLKEAITMTYETVAPSTRKSYNSTSKKWTFFMQT